MRGDRRRRGRRVDRVADRWAETRRSALDAHGRAARRAGLAARGGRALPAEIGRLAGVRIRVVPIARAWGTDISSVHTPLHAALDAAVRFDTGAFHRAGGAAGPRRVGGPRTRLCFLVLEDPLTVALGREPVRVTAPCSAT
jgi:hypothetical protein